MVMSARRVDPDSNHTVGRRMINATDALGEVTRFTYDSQGHLASRTDAAGQRMEYAYTPRGDLARTQDPAGAVNNINFYVILLKYTISIIFIYTERIIP